MFSKYKNLIVNLVFPTSGFGVGICFYLRLFLINCQLVLFCKAYTFDRLSEDDFLDQTYKIYWEYNNINIIKFYRLKQTKASIALMLIVMCVNTFLGGNTFKCNPLFLITLNWLNISAFPLLLTLYDGTHFPKSTLPTEIFEREKLSTSYYHQENMSVNCIPPQTPLLCSKTGVCRGKPIFLIFAPKHRLLVLVRTASARRF